jgi:hypothetical protein
MDKTVVIERKISISTAFEESAYADDTLLPCGEQDVNQLYD